jgi:hypothetical protein
VGVVQPAIMAASGVSLPFPAIYFSNADSGSMCAFRHKFSKTGEPCVSNCASALGVHGGILFQKENTSLGVA